jgi:ABC-type sulfate transport system permease component
MTSASQTVGSKPQIQQPAKSGSISLSKLLSRFLIYTTLIVLGITWIFPLYWMVTSSLKDDPQIYTVPPVLIPNPAFWNNFYDAWTRFDFNRAAFNSVFLYSVPVTFFTLVSSMLVAYGFARIPWRGRDTLFWICIATMMLPWQVTMVPLFIIFKNLGWINTYWPFVVPSLFGNAYFIFLLRQFFLGIPEELSDAARIDGANEFRHPVAHHPTALQASDGGCDALHFSRSMEQLPGTVDLHQLPGNATVGAGDLPDAHAGAEYGHDGNGVPAPDGGQHVGGAADHHHLHLCTAHLHRRHLDDRSEGLVVFGASSCRWRVLWFRCCWLAACAAPREPTRRR